MTAAEFAQRLKQKYPHLASIPDERLVAMAMLRYPQYRQAVTLDQAGPQIRQHMMELIGKNFGPGTTADLLSRMWTPGIKGPDPSPTDDPLYMNAMRKLWAGGAGPQTSQPVTTSYAQDLARRYRDVVTAASTLGVKP